MLRVTPNRGLGGQFPRAPTVDGHAESHYAVEAPATFELGLLRYRFWNVLAKRPIVYWRNMFVKLNPIPESYDAPPRRSRSIWGVLWRGR